MYIKKRWIADTIKIQFRYRTTKSNLLKNAKITLNKIKVFGIEYKPIESKCFKSEFNGKLLKVRGFGYIITHQYNYYKKVDIKFINKLKKIIKLYGNYKITSKVKIGILLDNGKTVNRVNFEYVTKFEQYKRFKVHKIKPKKRKYIKHNSEFWNNKSNDNIDGEGNI